MRKHSVCRALMLSVVIGLAGMSWGQEASETEGGEKVPHRIPRVNSEVRTDGVLDEPCWEEALVLPLEYEVRPGENVPPPVRTDVLLAYDESELYVAFRAYDPAPSLIRARLTDRDRLWDDDWVAINLDTFNDQRRSFLFVCNPLGVQADDIETQGGPTCPFDAIWDSGGRVNEEGYVVEMSIPFRALRFQRSSDDQIWGVDAIRSYPRSVRHHIGLFPRDRSNNCYLCQADKIIGFAGATPGRSLEFDPTVSAIKSEARQGDEDIPQGDFEGVQNSIEAGLTGTWGFTPNLTLCGTLNPDFSQIEADILQLDVNTQYALYYPERRPFFLEGMHMFESRLGVVYTRTLAEPDWGVKVTGKEGSNVIGFYTVRDAVTNFLFPSAYSSATTSVPMKSVGTVLRYRRDISSAATLGLFVTDREGEDYYNRVLSVDGDFRVTQKDRIQVQALGSATTYPDIVVQEEDQPEGRFKGSGLDVYYFHNTSTLDWYGLVRRLEPGIRADLGYRPQVDYNFGEAGLGYTFNRESGSWWTMLNAGGSYQYEETTAHELIQKGTAAWLNYTGPRDAFVNLNAYIGENRYEGENYDIDRLFYEGGFWLSRSIFVMLWGLAGDQIDYTNAQPGKVLSLVPFVNVKVGLNLDLQYQHTYERLDVEGGRLYTAGIDYLKAVYQFNKRTFARAILQYVNYDFDPALYVEETDSKHENVFTQFLFSYKINPQTVFYLGYSDNYYGNQDYVLKQSDRTIFAKIGYALIL
jgi:hypothetical protein